MTQAASSDVTQLLLAWGGGDLRALEPLYGLVYDHLHRLARSRMRLERASHTLQATALVHEAFLRLVDQAKSGWESRGHFYAIAAQSMRRVLVDHARRHRGPKRGGGAVHLPLEKLGDVAAQPALDVLGVHDALKTLATLDPRKAQMVELRFFGGLGIEETAECLHVSPGTVMRDWTLAKAWLKRQLRPVTTHP
ncbi:MAG: sigma-70 family RNA polymerase sigma factor [Acidobacteriota bacterium]